MRNEVIESLEKWNQTTLDSVKRLGAINARAVERLSEQQLGVAGEYLAGGVKQLKLFSEVKDLQEMLAAQTQLVVELNEKTVSYAREALAILVDTKDELVKWAEDGAKDVSGSPFVKAAPKKAA